MAFQNEHQAATGVLQALVGEANRVPTADFPSEEILKALPTKLRAEVVASLEAARESDKRDAVVRCLRAVSKELRERFSIQITITVMQRRRRRSRKKSKESRSITEVRKHVAVPERSQGSMST